MFAINQERTVSNFRCPPLLVKRELTLKSDDAFTGAAAAGGDEAEESLEGEAAEAAEAGDGGGDAAAVTSVVVIAVVVDGSSSVSSFSSGSSFIARRGTRPGCSLGSVQLREVIPGHSLLFPSQCPFGLGSGRRQSEEGEGRRRRQTTSDSGKVTNTLTPKERGRGGAARTRPPLATQEGAVSGAIYLGSRFVE